MSRILCQSFLEVNSQLGVTLLAFRFTGTGRILVELGRAEHSAAAPNLKFGGAETV